MNPTDSENSFSPEEFPHNEQTELDPEETARLVFEEMSRKGEGMVLITKLAIGGNYENQFANPCTVNQNCKAYDIPPDADFESLYSYITKNYEGGKFRLQLRQGQRNSNMWTVVLSDPPGTRPRGENADAAATVKTDLQPAKTEKKESFFKIAERELEEQSGFLTRMFELSDKMRPAPQQIIQTAAAQTGDIDKTEVLKLLQNTKDPETKLLCRELLGLGTSADEKNIGSALTGLAIDLLTDDEKRKSTLASVTTAAMPFLTPIMAPILERIMNAQQPPPRSMPPPPSMPPPAITPTDDRRNPVSPIVAPQANPLTKSRRRPRQEES